MSRFCDIKTYHLRGVCRFFDGMCGALEPCRAQFVNHSYTSLFHKEHLEALYSSVQIAHSQFCLLYSTVKEHILAK